MGVRLLFFLSESVRQVPVPVFVFLQSAGQTNLGLERAGMHIVVILVVGATNEVRTLSNDAPLLRQMELQHGIDNQ